MPKVFTITPGLENMGALKTGGQGSVYKGRRQSEVITAIKLLPTPIYSESAEDKNFIAFQNEVQKLKKVNEQPNPNVVKILSSGLTETGNLPFIEMEFIKGPDLEDLLKPPNDPVFTVKEVLKVAEQLSNALAHCHRLDVKHGDIKSNNIKFNTETSNYVLLDFGLAIMSDEQRRTSLRQAGAIEFMAPEQNTGQMLFQTDVYSFGVVLFELLGGSVPFPLTDKGEFARNEVRLAHMVKPLPALLPLRQTALPQSWDAQKQQHEMQVPEWLCGMVYKCLEKKPEARFANGIELYDYISENYVTANTRQFDQQINSLTQENKRLRDQHNALARQLEQVRNELNRKNQECGALKAELQQKTQEVLLLQQNSVAKTATKNSVSFKKYVGLLVVTIALSTFIFFSFLRSRDTTIAGVAKEKTSHTTPLSSGDMKAADAAKNKVLQQAGATKITQPKAKKAATHKEADTLKSTQKEPVKKDTQTIQRPVNDSATVSPPLAPAQPETTTAKPGDNQVIEKTETPMGDNDEPEILPNRRVIKTYKVVSKAYFYNRPDAKSCRNSFIGPWENALVDALDEKFGFIYVIIQNPKGDIFKGWLRKQDVKLYAIE